MPASDAAMNTDRELWREREGDYYADSIHVTKRGNIGINCGGTVIVKPLREWHRLAATPPPGDYAELVEENEGLKHDLDRYMKIANIECNRAEELQQRLAEVADADALTNAIWSKLNTIDTAREEGDWIATYKELRRAVRTALKETPNAEG